MMRTKVTRIVRHAPEEVFAVVSDPALEGSVQQVSGSGLGARRRTTHRVGHHEVVMEAVVTVWDPPHRLAWRTEHEALDHEAEVRLEPHRRGTRIVQVDRETWHHAPWWIRWSARPAVRRELQRRLARVEQALDAS